MNYDKEKAERITREGQRTIRSLLKEIQSRNRLLSPIKIVPKIETITPTKKGMTVGQIKKAVDEGKTVHWMNKGYRVVKNGIGMYLIKCTLNNHIIGLTWADDKTLNGDEEDFYEAEDQN